MVMPSSGPISMAQAHAEFGLGYSLSAYYGCDVGVPTSGPISLAHLYGKKKRTAYRYYRLFNITSIDTAYNPGIAEIELRETLGGADMTTANSGHVQSGMTSGSVDTPFDGSLTFNAQFSATTPRYIAVDLKSSKILRQLAIYTVGNLVNVGGFGLYGSDNSADMFGNSPTGTLLATYSGLAAVPNGWLTLNV